MYPHRYARMPFVGLRGSNPVHGTIVTCCSHRDSSNRIELLPVL